METILTIGKDVRLRANLDSMRAFKVFREFIQQITLDNIDEVKAPVVKLEQESSSDARIREVADAFQKMAKTIKPTSVSAVKPNNDTKLLVFTCGGCGDTGVVRVPRSTGVGDVVNCRCGHEMQIKDIKVANGDCPNCETRFHHMDVINGGTEVQCRNCRGLIDLVEQKDGTLTGRHNLIY